MRGKKASSWKRGALEARRRFRANATALSALWLIAIKGEESEGSESRVHALDLSDVASRVRWRDDVAMVDVLAYVASRSDERREWARRAVERVECEMTAVSATLTTKFAFAIVNSTSHRTRGVRAFEDFFFSGGRVLDDDFAVLVAAHRPDPSDIRASARVDCAPSDDGDEHRHRIFCVDRIAFALRDVLDRVRESP
jgi:hypothetical protein